MTETDARPEPADRYRKLAAAFTTKVAAVPDDRWGNPSPCPGWTALDVVRHVAETPAMFFGLVGADMGPLPSVDADPMVAWGATRDRVQAALDDPELANTEFDGFFGRSTFAGAVDRFVCFDLVVHGWDLARATGLDERIDPEEVMRVWNDSRAFGDALRTQGVCGTEVPVPTDADQQQRLLGFLGRHP
jgi:uncharacterized protein (TIGR03086 family)